MDNTDKNETTEEQRWHWEHVQEVRKVDLERERLTFEKRQYAHDEIRKVQAELNTAILKNGEVALRTSVLINGGACGFVLAFMGAIVTKQPNSLSKVSVFSGALSYFAYGVIAALTAIALTYVTNYVSSQHLKTFDMRDEPMVVPNPNTRVSKEKFVFAGPETPGLRLRKQFVHLLTMAAGIGSMAFFVFGLLEVRNVIAALK